jgi:cellulose synthase/poly-beta-1,6-N-acetylglucosamine synthase-like glycosyltransferase
MLTFIAWIIALPLIIALLIFTAETLLGLLPVKTTPVAAHTGRTILLMPAHNEADSIQSILDQLKPVLCDKIQLLVVADNCTDNTADVVRAADYAVIERDVADVRGKGHALAFGRDWMKQSPPDCVIVFDADCQTDAGSVHDLIVHCMAYDRPVQAQYVMQPDPLAAPMVQISNFAFWLKNAVRQRGGHRLGAAAVLVGTGMAFPWRLFETLPLATSNIVEDLALGIHLTEIGEAPCYRDSAMVISAAANEKATLGQRTRWEHGFITMAREYGLKALWRGITRGDRKLFQLGLHLMVPPLVMLFLMALGGLAALAICVALGGAVAPFVTVLFFTICAAIAVLLAWGSGGHRWASWRALLKVPFYIVWKIPVYLKLVRGDTPDWQRTERTPGSDT